MRTLILGLVASVFAFSVQAADLKDCSKEKGEKKVVCLDDNIQTLNRELASTVKVEQKFRLKTRGACLSFYDVNKAPITMSCDHADLQDWQFATPY